MQLLYFARVREQIGLAAEDLALPADVTRVAALLDWLAARSPGHAAALADRSHIRVAVDQDFATPDTPLTGASEVAIFPPVTGG
jgi:molybdopterin synthase sulfur carrier subunit